MVAPYTGLDLAPPPRSSRARREWKATPAQVLSMLDRREADIARRNRRLMTIGLCILTGVPSVLLTLMGLWCVRYQSRPVSFTAAVMGSIAGGTIVFSL